MKNANWIKGGNIFRKKFTARECKSAKLIITAKGVYEARLNGERVGDFILAPGFTSYNKIHQYQEYDITDMLATGENVIDIWLGTGWYKGMPWDRQFEFGEHLGVIAEIHLDDTVIFTDESWLCGHSPIISDSLYDGEVYNALALPKFCGNAQILEESKDSLVPQQGEFVKEHERFKPVASFTTPKGEKVLDFGQNIAGYAEFTVTAKAGERVVLSHAEVLDGDGNFYTENLRSAKQRTRYTCKDGTQVYKPRFTFMGFRYICVEEAPKDIRITAIAVYSDMRRTGYFKCSNEKINKLFENTIWGQKGNFLDVPTDCPQRDERLGWTGDAQAFIKAASYNFDVKKFFVKWLADLSADQSECGAVTDVVPNVLANEFGSAAWGDAATICPWQLYVTYGDAEILRSRFESMKKWVIFSRKHDRHHYGDWLGLDAEPGSYKGSSREDFISRAFNIFSTEIVIKTGTLLGENVDEFKKYNADTLKRFREDFYEYKTQTEHILALHFGLTRDKKKTAENLAKMIKNDGIQIKTGFVGTPYILHALSDNGYTSLAYDLLLRQEYPSWLYPITKGATTIWEHWDGIKPDGSFWSKDMNSFNHYAYGAVVDWLYEAAAGIKADEENPGFNRIIIAPQVDKRFDFLEASIDTKHGKVSSKWRFEGEKVIYEIEVPTKADIIINGETKHVGKGKYIFS